MRGRIYENKSGKGARWRVKYPGGIYRRFSNYTQAERFLTGLRFKYDEGILDPRDYRKDEPLGFENLTTQWLQRKDLEDLKCPQAVRLRIGKAVEFFGNCNVKTVDNRAMDSFRSWLLARAEWSGKYKADILSATLSFLRWVSLVETSYPTPSVSPIPYTLGMRKIVDKDTQIAILDEVKRLTWDKEPKIYIACLWMATYVNVRPQELLSISEADIDLNAGLIWIRHAKERRKDKRIFLLEEDLDWLRTLPTVLHPEGVPFFRHTKSRKGLQGGCLGRQFGKKLVYKWWKLACRNLRIEGVDLYGGTRHSSASDLGRYYSPEEVMQDGTGHTTSKSFLRYFHVRAEKRRTVAGTARRTTKGQRVLSFSQQAKTTSPSRSG